MKKERNLSGIFFKSKGSHRCFEDLDEEDQMSILEANENDPTFLKGMILKLSETLNEISEHFNIVLEEEQK